MDSVSRPSPFAGLPEILADWAARRPEAVAIRFLADGTGAETAVTYAALERRMRAVAGCLQAHADRGDRALLLLPSGLDYVVAFLGCLAAGIIAVPAYPPESSRARYQERVLSILADATPRLILTDAAVEETLRPLGAVLDGVRIIAVDAIDAACADSWRAAPAASGDVAFLQYTSGSTAAPKGVRVTHGNLFANECAIRAGFGIGPGDVIVSWLPLYHDMGLIGGLLQPLFSGVPVVLMSPRHFLERPTRWLEAIGRYGGTVSGGPDFAYRLCCDRIGDGARAGLDLSSWRVAFSGSEPVRFDTLTDFAARFRGAGFDPRALYPCYGLAEATLFVTGGLRGTGMEASGFDAGALAAGRAAPRDGGIPLVACGGAAAGFDVVTVDPGSGVETDGVGEIWAAGDSIADGYWNNPAATAETFVAHRGRTYLRTGDLGFLWEDRLFITGRRKDMIIVRGQNLYPQDLERLVEKEVAGVRNGRVAAFPVALDDGEGIGIAAEVGRGVQKTVPAADLARAVALTIADAAQQPPALVLLLNPGGLPKTSSGKTRRSACLPAWKQGTLDVFAAFDANTLAGGSGGAAATETERTVAVLWAEALGRPAAGAEDHFFLLGGTSLTAVRALVRVRAHYGIALEERLIFEAPVLRDFAAALDRRLAAPDRLRLPPPVEPGPDAAAHPLSPGQRRLWFLWRLAPASPAYTVAGTLHLNGPLDVGALERALTTLVAQQEALRTVIAPGGDGLGVQVIQPPGTVFLARTDLSGLDAGTREAAVGRLMDEEASRPFDLTTGPLLRLHLLRLGGREHRLLVVLHHIVSDGPSMDLFLDRLAALYRVGDDDGQGRPPVQYRDYARWQASGAAYDEGLLLAYWTSVLGSEHPPVTLPLRRPAPVRPGDRGAVHRFTVEEGTLRRLRGLARAHNATLFMVLLAAFALLLNRCSGQGDIRIGVPATNRGRPELDGLIGFFVNTLVLRTRIDGRQRFGDLLAAVRAAVLDARSHQDLPFERLVEVLRPDRAAGRPPLFNIMMTHWQGDGRVKHCGDLRMEARPWTPPAVQADLSLDVQEFPSRLELAFLYAADLHDAESVTRWAGYLQRLLAGLSAEDPIGEIEILVADERRRVVEAWGRGPVHAVPGGCVHDAVSAQAGRTPGAVAVVADGETLTYGELDERSNRLAHRLRAVGVGVETVVGIAVERSAALVVGLLGILKAGGRTCRWTRRTPRSVWGSCWRMAGRGWC